jgi:glycosyltransferase involved in cell wall biosynthesis
LTHAPDPQRKLIFVWNYLNWGGAQIYLLAIMREATTWDVRVFLPIGSSSDLVGFMDNIGVKYEFIDAELDNSDAPTLWRKVRRQWRRLRAELITYRVLIAEGIDGVVVHSEFAPWQSWIFYWMLCRHNARVFCTMHNALAPRPRWRRAVWKRRLLFLSRLKNFHIFASNQHAKDSLKTLVDADFCRRIPVTYTCVNPPEIAAARATPIDRTALRAKFGIRDDSFVVLTVGQFVDRKGRWTLLEAARIAGAPPNKVHFVWLTPELPNETDRSRIREYGVDKSFTLVLSRDVGSTRAEIVRFYQIADAFALPSFVDGLPIAILEAMAMGLPTIATRVYAIPEAIEDRVTGLLIDAGDARGLAAGILELADDAALRQRLADAGSRFVIDHFDERVASRLALQHYEDSLND